MPPSRLTCELLERYAAVGVDRIIVTPSPTLDGDRLLRFVRRNAPEAVGADRRTKRRLISYVRTDRVHR